MRDNPELEGKNLGATMRKKYALATYIQSYRHWNVLLRSSQATLGSVVLVG